MFLCNIVLLVFIKLNVCHHTTISTLLFYFYSLYSFFYLDPFYSYFYISDVYTHISLLLLPITSIRLKIIKPGE